MNLHGNSRPLGWAEARIGELIGQGGLFVDGDWVESKDQDPNGEFRLIQLADVGDGCYLNKSARFLTCQKAKELRCTLLEPGDLLIARMPDPLGRACIFPGDSRTCVTVVDVCIVRTGSAGICHRWLMHAINSPSFRSSVESLQSGSTRKRISRSNLATLVLPIPPLAEQHRIVAAIETQFSRLDAGIAALKRARANLKRYRAAVLKAACEGRLVPTEAALARAEGRDYEPASALLERIAERKGGESLPPLPEGWTWTTVGQAGHVQLGRQRAPKHHLGPWMRPYLRVANVYEDRLDLTDVLQMNFDPKEYETYRLEYGDVLLNEGQSLELVGRPAMYRGEIPGACFQNTLVRFRASAQVLPEWSLIVFRAYLHSQRFMQIARWTVNIAHLGAGRFAMLEFPLPPLQEQRRIVLEVDRQLSVIERLEGAVAASLKRAERLRQAILKRAFEGRLVPQDPGDEPASALLARIRAERAAAAANGAGRGRRAGAGRGKGGVAKSANPTTRQEVLEL